MAEAAVLLSLKIVGVSKLNEIKVKHEHMKKEPLVNLSCQWNAALHRMAALCLVALYVGASGCAAQGETAPGNGFRLQDTLGRTWNNEIVTFALSIADLQSVKAGRTLVGPDGKPVAYQPIAENNIEKVAFAADLNPFETRIYHFTAATTQPSTDLKIEKTAEGIRLTNSQTGILLRTKLSAGQGPVAGVRLPSGIWAGDSQLQKTPAFASYTATVTVQGPVFAEVLCRAQSSDGHSWELRVRLPANAPVVLMDETFNLQKDAAYTLNLSKDFTPDHLLYRVGTLSSANGRLGTLNDRKIEAGNDPTFVLEPWLHWWERDRQGNWFGLYNEKGNDLLSMAAYAADVWVDPNAKSHSPYQLNLEETPNGPTLNLPLGQGRRKWMITALDKTESLGLLQGKDLQVTPPPQEYLIKYGDFPLDVVKEEMAFPQMAQDMDHPRLHITKTQAAEFRKNFKADPNKLAQYRKASVSAYTLDGPMSYFLGTGDAELGRHLAEAAVNNMQNAVDVFLKQSGMVETFGMAPHNYAGMFFGAINLTDAVLSTPYISPEMRTRLQGQLAFLAYAVNRDDYWSPERGFSANPNMTSTVAAYRVALGAMLPMHPLSQQWMKRGLTELKHELDGWSDVNGGWLEAPHYAMATYDYMLGSFQTATNAGLPDYSYDPRMKKVAEWFAQISTPPDAGVLGWRHLPPIGNTYLHEITGEFGLVAGIWKEKDPAFAAQMQWMYHQQGSTSISAIGGFLPTLAGYHTLMLDPSIPEKAPVYSSTLFAQTGVVLHNHFPGDRETYLHMIAGNNHAHYDKDSGSVVVWGKGRRIADDFGYEGYMPGEDHNMVVSPIAPDDSLMHVKQFSTSPQMDYVRGQKQDWTRQIIFVKSSDPLAPNYFVINDSMSVPAPATWRLWLASNDVQLNKQGALAAGEQDVDTDIYFARPALPQLKTEQKTRVSYGLDSTGKYGKVPWTQTGLIADTDGESGVPVFTTVLFPRLKTDKTPVFTTLADGKVIKVQVGSETDYVFLNRTPFSFKENGIDFEGTSGLVRLHDGKAELALGDGGRLSAKGQTVQKQMTADYSMGTVNLTPDGDFEGGGLSLFVTPPRGHNLTISLYDGDPSPGGQHPGKLCMALNMPADGRAVALSKSPLFVDRRQVYRVSMDVYIPGATFFQAGSYASDGKNFNLKTPDGKIWEYAVYTKGPTNGWKTLETTIGPAGSDAKFQWSSNTLEVGMTLRLTGAKGMAYLDNVRVEPVTQKEEKDKNQK
jgi:hypothetical protein